MSNILKQTKNIILSNNIVKNIFKSLTGIINFKVKIRVSGKKFIIPVVKNVGLSNISLDEIWLLKLISKLIPLKNGVFIDVGSNTGQTLIELRSVDENIVYYGFEPNPTCVSYCINLIKVNKFSKSYIIPVGVFSENKVLNIHLTSETDSSGTIIEDLRPGYPVIERYLIPVMTFESIQKTVNIDDISIVKIDVEGSELEVFRSLEFTITKYKPIILCEILWAHNEDKLSYVSENNSKIIDLVHKMGYEIYRLIKSEDNNDVKSLENVKGIEKYVYSSSNSDLCDYIMIHQDYIEKVRELFPSNI